MIIGSGPSLRTYWEKIKKFIKDNNCVTLGCNNIMDFLIPDYHFWGSVKRLREFGRFLPPNSNIIVSDGFKKRYIREGWKGRYRIFKVVERIWKPGSENTQSILFKRCKVYYHNGVMYGCFRDISSLAIFWAYIKGAKKISVVGNDGYTIYSQKLIKNNQVSQHCYGKGYTDGFTYQYSRKKDIDKYRSLQLLGKYGKKKYGFKFVIITPTIYKDFYDPNILNIGIDYCWKEPNINEYSQLCNYLKNRKLKL